MAGESVMQLTSTIAAIIFVVMTVYQLCLFFGFPLAEFSWGGKYEGVLPRSMRLVSLVSAVILLWFAYVLLKHAGVITDGFAIPTTPWLWGITIFIGLNTFGNFFSKSKKEKLVMTPLTAIVFVCCLLMLIW